MIAIATVLVAFPAGFFFRSRTSAYLAYVAVFAYCYTFQGMYLLPQFAAEAGPNEWPNDVDKGPWSYGVVTALIYIVGFGLVTAGHALANRRRARAQRGADTPPPRRDVKDGPTRRQNGAKTDVSAIS